MITVKVSELTGVSLDWAVAKCEGVELHRPGIFEKVCVPVNDTVDFYSPSTDWAQGGPIIERLGIAVCKVRVIKSWCWSSGLSMPSLSPCYGDTPLIAAMRCYVASKLGNTMEIPEGLS